jgi:aryl-alcohol dehydrogenase-like predicted oxidoreductase
MRGRRAEGQPLMKIGLGSAQFGLDYGVSNTYGQTPIGEVRSILALAHEAGVSVLDTAAAYGDAESALGAAGVIGFRVVTKVPAGTRAKDVEHVLRASLARLGLEAGYGLLLHDPGDLAADDGAAIAAALERVRVMGLVAKIGISAYSAEHLETALSRMSLDLVQVPVNVFDQRLLEDGGLARLKRLGVEVHARSAFLQGLLLMEPDELPASLAGAREPLARFRRLAADNGWTPLSAALGFVAGLAEVDTVICGVNDPKQLRELLSSSDPLPSEPFETLALQDREIIDPTRWAC